MKRIELFEFEDFKWFPNWIRDAITSLIVVLSRAMGANRVVADLIYRVLERLNTQAVVDLGSGSGGSMPEVYEMLKEKLDQPSLLMTDYYPNNKAIETYGTNDDPNINYFSRPMDAANLASAPKGLKTMINCFHHMPPQKAKHILHSAQESKQPLLIYELSDNKMPTLIWWLFLPISLLIMLVMVVFMTPFVRPLSFKQVFFTYLIPIIPLAYAWDGQASMPRTYTLDDYDELLPVDAQGYSWEKGYAKDEKGKNKGVYVLGLPLEK